MSVGMQDPNIVVSADVNNYVQGMQTGYQETSKLSKAVVDLSTRIDDLRRNTAKKILIIDAAAMAGFTAATASAARLEDQMSQLEARSTLVARGYNNAAKELKAYANAANAAASSTNQGARDLPGVARQRERELQQAARQDFSNTIRQVSSLRREYGMAAESAISLLTVMNAMGSPNIAQSRNLASNYVRLSAVTGESVSGLATEQNQLMRTMGRGQLTSNVARNYSSMTAGLSQQQGVSALSTLGFANQIAPMARNMGMNQSEVMGFSTAFQKAGQDSGAASTAFNRILSSINFSKQWGGQDSKIYARYIGKSEEEFNKMPIAEAMTQIFEKIGKEGPKGAKFLEKMGFEGVRTQNAITALAGSGQLRQNLTTAAAAYRDPAAYEKASEDALSGLNEESRKTVEVFKEMTQVIGGIFLPGMLAGARLFNDTVGRVVSTFSDVLKGIPEPVKDLVAGATAAALALKGITLALGASGIFNAVVGGATASRLWNGPMATGMKSVLNPGMIGNPKDAAMLALNQGSWLQQKSYGFGQGMAGFLSTPLHLNPAKMSEDQKTEVAKKIESDADERRKTRSRMETERRLSNVIPVAAGGQADPKALASATKSMETAAKNMAETTDSQSPTRRQRLASRLQSFAQDNTVISKAQETAEKARNAATTAASAAANAVEGQTPLHLAAQGGRASVRGVRGAAGWLARQGSQMLGGMVDTGDGQLQRARDNSLFRATNQREIFLYRRAMSAGGWDADTPQGQRFRDSVGVGTPGYSERLRTIFAENKRIDNTPQANTSLMMSAGRGMGTAARGIGALGGMLSSAALGMLPGMLIMGGIGAVGAGMARSADDKRFREGLSESDGITASTEIYAQSLGMATSAVKDFGDAIRNSTPKGQQNKTIEDALTLSPEEAAAYQGRTENVVNTALIGTSKDQATSFMASLLNSTDSVELVGTAAADLAAIFNPAEAQKMMDAAKQMSESGTYGGYFGAAEMRNKTPDTWWKNIFPERYDNTALANQAYAGVGQRFADANRFGGESALASEFTTAITELIESSQTDDDNTNKEADAFVQHLKGVLGTQVDLDSPEGRKFLERMEKAARYGSPERNFNSMSGAGLSSSELEELLYAELAKSGIEMPFSVTAGGAGARDLRRGTPDWFEEELKDVSFNTQQARRLSELFIQQDSGLSMGNFQTLQNRLGSREPNFGDFQMMQGPGINTQTERDRRAAFYAEAAGAEANEAKRFTAGRMLTTDVLAQTGGDISQAKSAVMDFISSMEGASNGLDSFAASVLGNLRGLEVLQRSSQGRVGLTATSQDALSDVNIARQIYEANPDNAAAKKFFEEMGAASIGKETELDSFFRTSARGLMDMQRGQSIDRANLTRSQGRQQEEYGISMGRQQASRTRQLGWEAEDWTRSLREREEDFFRQRAYQEEDYNRSREEAFTDYHRSRMYAEQDYQKSRRREEEDYNHQIKLMAASTAKSVFDIYSRAAVERTWSLQGLLQNVADQQRRMTEQKANLGALRDMGVSDAVIEQLGLAGGDKAQQLERLLNGLRNGEGTVAQLNSSISQRVTTAGQLATDESNPQFREMEYQREKGLARQETDFREGQRRTEENFILGMDRMAEANERNNERSLTEFNRQGTRMTEAHERQLNRSNVLFNEQVAQSNEDFQRAMDNQWKDLEYSHQQALDSFEYQLQEYNLSTEASYKLLMDNLSKVSQGTLTETKKVYDDLSATNRLIYAEVGVMVSDSGEGASREFAISKLSDSNGIITWRVGTPAGKDTRRGTGGPEAHIGGPEANADVAHAKGLGSANGIGGSIDYKVGKVSQGFHGAHPGVDVPGRTGDPVRAAGDGVVAFAGNGGAYGNFTKIVHSNGLETWYGHQAILGVHTGDRVSSGQPIGTMGTTGHSSGPHLHYEVRINGQAVDPGATDLDGEGGIGGPNFHNSPNFRKWESIIDKTPYRLKLRRGGLADMWNRRVAEHEAAQQVDWSPMEGKVQGDMVKVGRHSIDKASYDLFKAAERIFGSAIQITQGGFNNKVSASAGTHAGAGVIDSVPATVKAMNAFRRVGAASWLREPWEGPWNRHVHTVFNVPGLSSAAANQYRAYLQGRNGLSGGGKDRYPRVEADEARTTTVNGASRPVPNKHSGWNGGRYRSSGKWHGGLDFPAATGTPVRAMWDGSVTAANYWNYSYGRHVKMSHPNGLETLYAHMSRILVSKGDKLRSGEQLGAVGNTGNSRGSHLHLETRKNGTQLNPTQYLPGYVTGTHSAIPGMRPVGEHGMEIIFSKSMKQFLGGESVLNNLQTRNAFGRGLNGTPAASSTAGPSSIHYDNSMHVEKMEVVANDTGEIYSKAKRDQRLRALSGGR